MADNLNPTVCYYRTLKLKRTATQSQIVKAYKKSARLYDPARNKNPTAAERYARIQTAYAVLSSRFRRAEYDLARQYQTAHWPFRRYTNAKSSPITSAGSTYSAPVPGAGTGGAGAGGWNLISGGNGIVTSLSTTAGDPPTLSSSTGGVFTTSTDGRTFTVVAGTGHTYILGGGQGTLNATGHQMTIISRATGGQVNVKGNGVKVTASGTGTTIQVDGNHANCTASGTGTNFTANGDSACCDALGAGTEFTAQGNSAHCHARGVGVTFTSTGQGATYDSIGCLSFIFRGNNGN